MKTIRGWLLKLLIKDGVKVPERYAARVEYGELVFRDIHTHPWDRISE